MSQQLTALRAQRAKLAAERDACLEKPTQEYRDLTDAEKSKFDTARGRVAKLDLAIIDAEETVTRSGNVDRVAVEYGQTGGRYGLQGMHTSGGLTYNRGDQRSSWARDLVGATIHNDPDATDRLRQNSREVSIETRALSGDVSGAGGYMIPPLWLVNEYVAFARAARVIASQVRNTPLPPGTNVINLPRVATGTATLEQTTQNTTVIATDATFNSIAANVATLAGSQIVSVQLIEQSPANIDEVLMQDLMADLAQRIDVFTINNNATNKVGILNVAGINSIVLGAATVSATSGSLYQKLADAIQQIQTKRYMPPQKIFMHPRRWAWCLQAVDTANRPLVVPNSNSPQNTLFTSNGMMDANGFVGTIMGLPVYTDANIPVNLGAGTNEDRIIVAKADDIILYEGVLNAEAFREPLAQQLSILIRVYQYVALHASRYPASISVISGVGLITPSFA